MKRAELLSCMREAADALAEFRHLLPQHSPEAHGQMEAARQHLDYAITLLRHAPRNGHGHGRPGGGEDPPCFRLVP